jgi:hypothetical protein
MKYKIVSPPSVKKPITLTRYLYIKEEVLISLTVAILEKNRDEALFWAYELYWSGFQEEVFEYLMSMFWELFESFNPRLRKFLQSQVDAWLQDPTKHSALGSIVRNLADKSRAFQIDTFILKTPPVIDKSIKDHRFYIELEDKDVIQYENALNEEYPRLYLGKACRFSSKKEYNNIFGTLHNGVLGKDILEMVTDNWEYYASRSPLWKERMLEYNATIDDSLKHVTFEDDVDHDSFYDLYGYEPDEQPLNLLAKITHVNPVVQMSLREFCVKFGATPETLAKI